MDDTETIFDRFIEKLPPIEISANKEDRMVVKATLRLAGSFIKTFEREKDNLISLIAEGNPFAFEHIGGVAHLALYQIDGIYDKLDSVRESFDVYPQMYGHISSVLNLIFDLAAKTYFEIALFQKCPIHIQERAIFLYSEQFIETRYFFNAELLSTIYRQQRYEDAAAQSKETANWKENMQKVELEVLEEGLFDRLALKNTVH